MIYALLIAILLAIIFLAISLNIGINRIMDKIDLYTKSNVATIKDAQAIIRGQREFSKNIRKD